MYSTITTITTIKTAKHRVLRIIREGNCFSFYCEICPLRIPNKSCGAYFDNSLAHKIAVEYALAHNFITEEEAFEELL